MMIECMDNNKIERITIITNHRSNDEFMMVLVDVVDVVKDVVNIVDVKKVMDNFIILEY